MNPKTLRKMVAVIVALSWLSAVAVAQKATVHVPGDTAAKPSRETPSAAASQPASTGLSVDDVVAMVKAGLGEDVIILAIRNSEKSFDLSAMQLVQLKQSGVSDNVLKVMLDPKAEIGSAPAPTTAIAAAVVPGTPVRASDNPSGATPAAPEAISGDPNDPLVPHDSGIWLYTKDRDGNPKMIVLERAAYQGSKSGGYLTSKLTLGVKKVKMRAVIPGPRASIRVAEPTPTFYFYFDDKAAGLGRSYFGSVNVSNPNQFALIKLETRKSNRETIIGQVGALGSSSGTHEESMMPFKSERIRPGFYKVVPGALLPDGEYCFLASVGFGAMGSGAAGAVDIFDFAISSE